MSLDPASSKRDGASSKHLDSQNEARHVPPPLDRDYLSHRKPMAAGSGQGPVANMDQVKEMTTDEQMDINTFGVSELREGFFDALFLGQSPLSYEQLEDKMRDTLPEEFDRKSISSPKDYAAVQIVKLQAIWKRLTATRDGIRLFRSFLAVYIAYILCLVPAVRDWLGRYHYVMVLSVITNHPARTFGSQIDGAVLTIIGTAAGLAWGVIALLLSTSTIAASAGYGGILALFLALFMTTIAWMRSFFIRFYQGVMTAGLAITFTCLAETSDRGVEWTKVKEYGVSWVLGQVLALIVNCIIFPDAGARSFATTIHEFFDICQTALIVPRPRDLKARRQLSRCYIDLAVAYRDLRIDVTITRFTPDDAQELRYLMQSVVRALLSMETETYLFDKPASDQAVTITVEAPDSQPGEKPTTEGNEEATRTVINTLAQPTKDMLACMREGLNRSDAALMNLSGYRKHLGPPSEVSSDISTVQVRLKGSIAGFATMESTLLDSDDLPLAAIQDSEVVRLFVFARHVREAATAVQKLLVKVNYMQHTSGRPKLALPSYPFWKAIHRTNKQVRHDRGGITAGSYQITFAEISKLLDKIASREHKPIARGEADVPEDEAEVVGTHATMNAKTDGETKSSKTGVGYKVWRVLHRLQGFETRYAFKVCLVCSLLSVPSYLQQSQGWWDRYEVWWAVSMSWIMLHPRVGSNLQDLIVRAFSAILGAVWSGAAIAAGKGNPYVLAVFAAIYLLPMMYRFTQSSHPRSGLVGCFSFTVISLGLQSSSGDTSTSVLAVAKGLSFLVGTSVPVFVNWVLWPFIARHELRSGLSSMLFFMSIVYRSVVGRYIYYDEGKEPTEEDVKRSEILEGRLREGFLRIRQLLVLSRHEIRLRASFDPLPYSALTDACEHFFDYLIAVRQSALYHQPVMIRDNRDAADKLLGYRRDAVAAIMGNLYILAGALRSRRQVPRYLPSAVAARKKFLRRIAELREEAIHQEGQQTEQVKKWCKIYSYSYNESLTGCVAQLEELEKYTKLIVGEQGLENDFVDDDSDEEQELLHEKRNR